MVSLIVAVTPLLVSPSPPLPVGVHEHIHFDWPRGEHCCQNSPAENHFYKVIFYPGGHPGAGCGDTGAVTRWRVRHAAAQRALETLAPQSVQCALETLAPQSVLFFSS